MWDPDVTEYIHQKCMVGDHFTVEAILQATPEKALVRCGRMQVPPLFYACRHGHVKVARVLLDSGFTDKQIDGGSSGSGWSALHEACFGNHTEVVHLLLRRGADPDVTVKYSGLTPLVQAAKRGNADICEALLQTGADPWKVSVDGRHALACALASPPTSASGSEACSRVLDRYMRWHALARARCRVEVEVQTGWSPVPFGVMEVAVHTLNDDLFRSLLAYFVT